MKVLVTGAAGFIGSHLCDALIGKGCKVLAVDNLSMGNLENLEHCLEHPNFTVWPLDIIDSDAVMAEFGDETIDIIIHLAAFKIPRYGNAVGTLSVNGLGAFTVLALALQTNASVLMISTSDVYGKNPLLPFDEGHDSIFGPSTVPRWSYAVSKLFAEHLAFAYQDAYKVPITIARLFSVYGPRQHLSWWGGPQSAFISAILRDEEIEIHGSGYQTRSFCYIDDVIRALIKIVGNKNTRGQILNIGSEREITIFAFARLIKKLSGTPLPLKLRYVPYSAFGEYEDVKRRVPNIEKAKRLIDWSPKVSLEEGLQKTIGWQRGVLGP